MIEQIHYTTTAKYNFPRALRGMNPPEKFIELSLNSMSEIRDKCFQPWIDLSEQRVEEFEEQENTIEVYDGDYLSLISPLKPIPDGTPVVAIDTSSIKVGETESGIICAVRGAVVCNERKRYRYLRIGPFPFHITKENKRKLLNSLGEFSPTIFSVRFPFLMEVQSTLCNALERWIQMAVSKSIVNSVILFDGSLSAKSLNGDLEMLTRILREARSNSNSVLSFSKASTVKFLGKRITDLIAKQKEPCLLEINERMLSLSTKNLHLLGKIYVAKLSEKGYTFRVDIDRALPKEIRVIVIQKILGNDITFQGYPETLRLAHIFSTFTASDVIGIQRFISKKYGLRVVSWPNVRKALFGPFGTGGAGD